MKLSSKAGLVGVLLAISAAGQGAAASAPLEPSDATVDARLDRIAQALREREQRIDVASLGESGSPASILIGFLNSSTTFRNSSSGWRNNVHGWVNGGFLNHANGFRNYASGWRNSVPGWLNGGGFLNHHPGWVNGGGGGFLNRATTFRNYASGWRNNVSGWLNR